MKGKVLKKGSVSWKDVVGGQLILTTEALYVFLGENKKFEVDLKDIKEVKPCPLPNTLYVFTYNSKEEVTIFGKKKWVEAINNAVNKEKLRVIDSGLKTKSVLNGEVDSFNNTELEHTNVNSSYTAKSHGILFYVFLSFIPLIAVVCFLIFRNDKISGCYSRENLKICISGDKIVMNDEVTYYANYIGKSVYIEDKYGGQLGYCKRVKDSKNIYCVYNGIGLEYEKR